MSKSEVVTEVMDSFRRIVQALRSSHRAAADVDLTGAQLFVLSVLRDAKGPLGVSELAEQTRTDQSTVSVVVARLVERGLVARERSGSDSRRVKLSLTAAGKALLRKTPRTVAQQRLTEALGTLSGADAKKLLALLQRVVEAMGETDAPVTMLFEEPRRKKKR